MGAGTATSSDGAGGAMTFARQAHLNPQKTAISVGSSAPSGMLLQSCTQPVTLGCAASNHFCILPVHDTDTSGAPQSDTPLLHLVCMLWTSASCIGLCCQLEPLPLGSRMRLGAVLPTCLACQHLFATAFAIHCALGVMGGYAPTCLSF